MYAELHCHSHYSFQEGASSIDELALQASRLGYSALALTDHDNLCGAMEFAQTAKALGLKAITGAEVTLGRQQVTLAGQQRSAGACPPQGAGGPTGDPVVHLTLLATTPKGYSNLCRLLSYGRLPARHAERADCQQSIVSASAFGAGGGLKPALRTEAASSIPAERPQAEHDQERRRHPVLDPALLAAHAEGLIALSGCRQGEVPSLIAAGQTKEAEAAARTYLDWFGPENFYLELQHNLVYGDDDRIRGLIALGKRLGVPVVATNNAHYHVRSRHRLQDALVAIKACKTLEETHRERRPNSEFFLKSPAAMAELFAECPEAVATTLAVAERCSFDLTRDLDYRFPDYPVPQGHTPDSYLEHLCYEAARRRYGNGFAFLGGRAECHAEAASDATPPAAASFDKLRTPSGGEAASRGATEGGWAGPQRGVGHVRKNDQDVPPSVHQRLREELRLIKKHGLAGFLLIYHDVIEMAREVMRDLGLCPPHTPLEDCLPGRGRGSSVAMLTGYLIGLSHIDPLKYGLSLDRFLPEDLGPSSQSPLPSGEGQGEGDPAPTNDRRGEVSSPGEGPHLSYVPDIDLDFPRNIREELIKRVHARWGWDHAALSGMIDTYQTKGAVRDLGKVLGLPPDDIDKLAKQVEGHRASGLKAEMETMPDFREKVTQPGWRDLIALAAELDGFPRHLAQHPGGMIISSKPLIDLVPIQPGAIEGRYVCQWDKDSIDDAGFVKIDFLSLGALSQMQDALKLIEQRHGECIDLTRIDFDDQQVYDSLCRADTIGIFQVESAAQMQTIVRLRPRDLTDMAHEVGAVRPGVGANHGVAIYLARRLGQQPVTYDHPLEEKALSRTLGVILFQDQVNQLAMDVAGFSASEADQLRRAFTRRRNKRLIAAYWEQFRQGAAAKGVSPEAAKKVFQKFNGEYMFPESHAFAFGVTAYHAAWLKYYYPLEFYAGLFNQQPMGFYNLETLKEDAKRHGVMVLNPDINGSREQCTIDDASPWERRHLACPGESGDGLPSVLCPPPSGGEAVFSGVGSGPPIPWGRGGALRIGLEQVINIGEKLAKMLMEERDAHGPYRSLADFMERTGLPQRSVENLVEAGAFDGLLSDVAQAPSPAFPENFAYLPKTHVHVESGRRGGYDEGPVHSVFPYGGRAAPSPAIPFPDVPRQDLGPWTLDPGPAPDRRRGIQEAALRYQTGTRTKHGYQLSLPFPVDQDLLDVPPQSEWDRMEGEYRTMGLFPAGHVLAYLRRHLSEAIAPSNMMDRFPEGATVTTAGLVIRRQHPLAKAIFLTLEDEFGHIPIIVWLDVYQRYKLQFKEPFVIVTGQVSRRDGTFNIIAQRAETFRGNTKPPKAKSWS